MQMIFSWIVSSEFKDNILMPDCNVSEPYWSLGAFLNDDGGGIEYLQQWISKGINEVDNIKKE